MMDSVPGYPTGGYDPRGQYIPTSAERTAYQAERVPWADQVVYGYYTLAFPLGVLVLAALAKVVFDVRVKRVATKVGKVGKVYGRVAAALRLATYPRTSKYPSVWTWGPLGPNLILLAGLLLASGLTWINSYYYYAPYYGSAPLYLRSEWVAMATLPFVYVLGSKRNVISVLTGVSHEKLQVLHQGAAFNFVYMSLVHTIAACIRANRQHGLALTLKINEVYVSGFVALGPLLVLFAASLPPLRGRAYEVFYGVHIVMAVFFLGALFWHGYKLLDSDAYCIATIVLFLGSVIYRLTWILLDNPTWHTAHVEFIDEDTLRIRVPSLTLRWRAGQHVFLRFIGVRPLESHPFTIACACHETSASSWREMVFIVRVRTGFTRSLAAKLTGSGSEDTFRVLIDGPYGSGSDELRAFDSVLLCVGGSGIAWALGVLQALVGHGHGQNQAKDQGKEPRQRQVSLIWAIRDIGSQRWAAAELAALKSKVDIRVYVTGEDVAESTTGGKASDEKQEHVTSLAELTPTASGSGSASGSPSEVGKVSAGSTLPTLPGRPDMSALIAQYVVDAPSRGASTVAIAACGPDTLITDCANAVARAQVDVLRGRGVEEVYLCTEAYGW